METYWEEQELEGYKDIKYYIRGEKDETVTHICECEVKKKWTPGSQRLLKNGKVIPKGKIENAKWKTA